METTAVNQSPPLGIARKPLGLTGFAGGPFKPITQGFTLFFEALLCSVALGNADTIETLSHLDVCAENDAHLTKSVSDKVIKEDKHTIEAPVIASHITPDSAESTNETVAECTLATKDTLALSTESAIETQKNTSLKEETITCAEDIVPVDISPVVDITPDAGVVVPESNTHTITIIGTAPNSPEEAEATEVSPIASTEEQASSVSDKIVAIEEHITSEIDNTIATEAVAAECAEDISDSSAEDTQESVQIASPEEETLITTQDETPAITLAADCTQAIVDISVSDDVAESPLEAIEPTEDIQVTAEVACTEDAHVADIAIETTEVVQETPAAETAQAIQDMPPALKNITVPDLVDDSESDIKVVLRDILDTNEDLDFESDFEAEAENELSETPAVYTMESIPEKQQATIPTPSPVYPLIFEDDFDAAVSSIFNIDFEQLMEIEFDRSIPQIAEKGKSEREVLRERLANKETAQFNPQNLRLEKFARALSINGPLPVKPATKKAAPEAEIATPTTHVEPETAVPKYEAETPAEVETKTEAQQVFSDTEEATIEKAKEITSRNHSRSSSDSSAASHLSAEAGFDSAPCPGTPMTEHSGTPPKDGAPYAISTEETIPQQAADTDKNNTGGAEIPSEEPAAEAVTEEGGETTD
jgi:hypothetical protein